MNLSFKWRYIGLTKKQEKKNCRYRSVVKCNVVARAWREQQQVRKKISIKFHGSSLEVAKSIGTMTMKKKNCPMRDNNNIERHTVHTHTHTSTNICSCGWSDLFDFDGDGRPFAFYHYFSIFRNPFIEKKWKCLHNCHLYFNRIPGANSSINWFSYQQNSSSSGSV